MKLEMANDTDYWEKEISDDDDDSEVEISSSRKLITQPYDLAVRSLCDQIDDGTISLSPSYQRKFIANDEFVSKLIESIIINVPIPPCYLSQNEDYEFDVIDGQQRLGSIYNFFKNKRKLKGLKVTPEFNGDTYIDLPSRVQRSIATHTVRCISINNDSDEDIKFEVFERLNSNTNPLNPQELRNCIYRGTFNDAIIEMNKDKRWRKIIGKPKVDQRFRDVELVLRFFAFKIYGVDKYRSPLKNWLNDLAKEGRNFGEQKIERCFEDWDLMLTNMSSWFSPRECFRRKGKSLLNRGIFDLMSQVAVNYTSGEPEAVRAAVRQAYYDALDDENYLEVTSKSIDHKSRTISRFSIWDSYFCEI